MKINKYAYIIAVVFFSVLLCSGQEKPDYILPALEPTHIHIKRGDVSDNDVNKIIKVEFYWASNGKERVLFISHLPVNKEGEWVSKRNVDGLNDFGLMQPGFEDFDKDSVSRRQSIGSFLKKCNKEKVISNVKPKGGSLSTILYNKPTGGTYNIWRIIVDKKAHFIAQRVAENDPIGDYRFLFDSIWQLKEVLKPKDYNFKKVDLSKDKNIVFNTLHKKNDNTVYYLDNNKKKFLWETTVLEGNPSEKKVILIEFKTDMEGFKNLHEAFGVELKTVDLKTYTYLASLSRSIATKKDQSYIIVPSWRGEVANKNEMVQSSQDRAYKITPTNQYLKRILNVSKRTGFTVNGHAALLANSPKQYGWSPGNSNVTGLRFIDNRLLPESLITNHKFLDSDAFAKIEWELNVDKQNYEYVQKGVFRCDQLVALINEEDKWHPDFKSEVKGADAGVEGEIETPNAEGEIKTPNAEELQDNTAKKAPSDTIIKVIKSRLRKVANLTDSHSGNGTNPVKVARELEADYVRVVWEAILKKRPDNVEGQVLLGGEAHPKLGEGNKVLWLRKSHTRRMLGIFEDYVVFRSFAWQATESKAKGVSYNNSQLPKRIKDAIKPKGIDVTSEHEIRLHLLGVMLKKLQECGYNKDSIYRLGIQYFQFIEIMGFEDTIPSKWPAMFMTFDLAEMVKNNTQKSVAGTFEEDKLKLLAGGSRSGVVLTWSEANHIELSGASAWQTDGQNIKVAFSKPKVGVKNNLIPSPFSGVRLCVPLEVSNNKNLGNIKALKLSQLEIWEDLFGANTAPQMKAQVGVGAPSIYSENLYLRTLIYAGTIDFWRISDADLVKEVKITLGKP